MRATFLLNICALVICTLAACAAIVLYVQKRGSGSQSVHGGTCQGSCLPGIKRLSLSGTQLADFLLAEILLVGIILRLFRLAALPCGLNQDEASLGYEAYVLATYGTDRFGYLYPVYPITWGSGGGGPLMIYLMMLPVRLLGPSVFSVRIVPALLGILALPVCYALLKKLLGTPAALTGTLLLALSPWHVMFSRWALDNRPIPVLVYAALLLFLTGTRTKKTAPYLISVVFFSLILYSYGSALFVIPCFLILACAYQLRRGRMTRGQCAAGVVLFILLILPLLAFYVINALDLPEVVTPFFSIERLRLRRQVFYAFDASLPGKVWDNLKYLLLTMTVGNDSRESYYDFIPGFSTLFRFTFPVTFLGLGVSFGRFFASLRGGTDNAPPAETERDDSLFVLFFICSFVFALFVEPDISRLCLIFVAEIYFFAAGADFIMRRIPLTGPVLAALICAGALLFSRDYFGSRYEALAGDLFMPGYGGTIKYAAETADRMEDEAAGSRRVTVYSTYEGLNAPYMLALFYDRTSPREFMDTAVFRDEENAEFLIAESFGRFVFGLPDDILDEKYRGDVVIAHSGRDADRFPEECYERVPFGHFQVLIPRQVLLPR